MSNYINNLIARNQQTAEVVRPRLPFIFEPPVHARTAFNALNLAGPLASQQAANEEIEPRVSQAGQAESNTVRAEQEPPAGEASHEAQITNVSSPETQIPAWRGIQLATEYSTEPPSFTPRLTDARDSKNRLATAIHSNINEPPDETSQRRLDTNRETQLPPRPVSSQKNEAEIAERREQQNAQADSQQPLPRPSLPSRRPAHERIAQPVIEEARRAASSVESTASRIVVQPRVARRDENYTTREAYRSGHDRGDFQSHEPPPMPTINVTIGRIEVKALPPAAAPSRPQKTAAPLMSLDEYMRRRNTGGDSV